MKTKTIRRAVPRPLKDTLRRINWIYGRGEIIRIDMAPDGKGGACLVKKQYGQEHPRFTIHEGDMVRFRGQLRKIKPIS